MADNLQGRLAAYGSAFKDAVQLLGDDADQLETDLLNQAEDLRTHFGDPAPTSFLQDVIDSYEFIALLIRHRHDFRAGHPGIEGLSVIICLKCEVFPIDLVADVCPVCGTSKWLHITRC